MADNKSVYETLSAINVDDKIRESQGAKYLPWIAAWQVVKSIYPTATYQVVESVDGKTYHAELGLGIMVRTEVTIEGETLPMHLPVLDTKFKTLMLDESYTYTVGKGKSWEQQKTVERATMFDINTSIMRCLTKNLAMFGLGAYIYAREDYVSEQAEAEKTVTNEGVTKKAQNPKAKESLSYIKEGSADWKKVATYRTGAGANLEAEMFVRQVEQKFKVSKNLREKLLKLPTAG